MTWMLIITFNGKKNSIIAQTLKRKMKGKRIMEAKKQWKFFYPFLPNNQVVMVKIVQNKRDIT